MKQFNLSIPTPCHEDWNQMSPTDQGRFCSSCQKKVIDFTTMSDRELAAYFKKSSANTCGRFMADQLERDIVIPTKRIPWLRYFFQFTLPAFLLSLKAAGQKSERVEKVNILNRSHNALVKDTVPAIPGNVINGKVLDDKGNPIPNAAVMIKGTRQATVCDADGQFRLAHNQVWPITLQISSVGFESREHQVNSNTANEVVLITTQAQLMGEVVIVGYVRRPKKHIPLINNTKRDTTFNQFNVYPNPARSNGTITIDCKKMNKGEYTLNIMAIGGASLCMKPLVLEEKGGILRTDLPTLIPGHYLLTLQHKKSNKVYTEKIQVL